MCKKTLVYLSGEIHSDWRTELEEAGRELQLPLQFIAPEINHAESDSCGEVILGPEDNPFWTDHKAAKINTIRHRMFFPKCDLLIVKFGDKYRQWNAAFDAGMAASSGKPYITLHDKALDHALKEVDASALAVARSTQQVVDILKYVTKSATAL